MLLQHPRERNLAIGTARMASLCLPQSELHVGVDWSGSDALASALGDPLRPPALLYPGEGAIDIGAHPPPGPITLIVVDGTWHHARKLVRINPVLAALPRYSFTPTAPSEYRIRKEPQPSFVSTLEALAHVLGVLEGDPERFRAMLTPFRAMIDAQIACERAEQNHRGRAPRGPRPERPDERSVLRARVDDLVCVIAEANAWRRRGVARADVWPDELVQWIAHRPSTGETFESVLAPRHPIGPGTVVQTGIPQEALATGDLPARMRERWRAFVRDTDVVCSWGEYGTRLMESEGGFLPATRIDLRAIARRDSKGKPGTPGEYLARAGRGIDASSVIGTGRAGARLAQITAVARYFAGH